VSQTGSAEFSHRVSVEERVKVVTVLEPQIDQAGVDGFKALLEREVFASDLDVILHLEGVEYLSSIALGLISLAAVMIDKRGVRFVVVCSREPVLKLFVISGLYKAVKFSNSVESARHKLASAGSVPPTPPQSAPT
jgi:anti-anti-sigma factor